jgi:hypothetical protein
MDFDTHLQWHGFEPTPRPIPEVKVHHPSIPSATILETDQVPQVINHPGFTAEVFRHERITPDAPPHNRVYKKASIVLRFNMGSVLLNDFLPEGVPMAECHDLYSSLRRHCPPSIKSLAPVYFKLDKPAYY